MDESAISLQQLNGLIKDILEGNFMEEVWVIAEIAEIRRASSGHCYCELVEKKGERTLARMRGNIWSFQYQRILSNFFKITGGNLQAGMEVMCLVQVSFHEVFGLSLNIKNIDPSFTLGAHEKRKKEILDRLKKEGLMGLNAQIEFPFLPQNIAVISSESAAGYEDFLNQVDSNIHGYRIYTQLFPATMQGDDTSPSIQKALQQIRTDNRLFDVVMILRGGGATLDLAAFDDYELCRSIAEFPLPIISGIGHERDHTLVDDVVHTKLKTPTAAAAFIIDHFEQIEGLLLGQLDALKYVVQSRIKTLTKKQERLVYQLSNSSKNYLKAGQQKLTKLSYGMVGGAVGMVQKQKGVLQQLPEKMNKGIRYHKSNQEQYLVDLRNRIGKQSKQFISEQQKGLKNSERALTLVDPQNVLKRGYAIVYGENDKIVKSSDNKEKEMTIRFKDGNIKVKRDSK